MFFHELSCCYYGNIFFIFFISNVYPGPIYRFCIKYRSSGRPSITSIVSLLYITNEMEEMILYVDQLGNKWNTFYFVQYMVVIMR